MFKILIVDSERYENHIGEEWDDVEEVLPTVGVKALSEYEYKFCGLIRSVWKEIDKEIYLSFDVSDLSYYGMFETIKRMLEEREGIFFSTENNQFER